MGRRLNPLVNRTDQIIVALLAEGKTLAEIAPLVGCSRMTVTRKMARIRRELDAKTTAQAVALAIRSGYI